MDLVRYVAEDRIPGLSYRVEMTAEDIFGEDAWEELSDGEARLAGKCLRRLVKDNALPLDPVETVHEYPLYYQRR
jgi:hypothetical protein